MEPPGITRHRRPFLAPLWLSLAAAFAVGGIAWVFYRSSTTTLVIMVRPDEKDAGKIEDPPLSPEGEEGAERLAHIFGDTRGAGGIDVVYASDDRRARQTAAPLVERVRRALVVFSAADAQATAARALREHCGGTVLVVASGAALPRMMRELTGSDVDSAPYDAVIYLISIPTLGRAHLVQLRF